ncbi:MAG: beta-galactosidase trimerization domain-containing protein [Kiritimatiellae bacterium]|nr:beta-galactosidase trimerization domain-containing protein [Kiritimatiellia bacterium]
MPRDGKERDGKEPKRARARASPEKFDLRLPRHMRIAALQCNFEGGPEATLVMPEAWNEFGFNVEQLLHTHSELYTAVYETRHRPLVERYLEKLIAKDMRAILYMNCHILPPSQTSRAAEWAQMSRDGKFVMSYDTYYSCCLNSSWSDYFLGCLASLAGLNISGVFLDGPSFSPCFCPRCAARFQREYGGSLAIASPDQVQAFTLRCQIDFIRKAYLKVKQVNPDWVAYFNLPILNARVSAAEMAELLMYNDLVGTEGGFQFYGAPRDVAIWRCGLHARMLEAVAEERPKVIFMAGDHKPWSWYLHTPAETKLCYASALASGASVWYGIHCSSENLRSAAGEAAKAMVQFDRKWDSIYEKTVSLADVAVFFSFDTSKRYPSGGEQTDFYAGTAGPAPAGLGNYRDAFQGAVAALFRSGVAWDVITELNLEQLYKYAVVVVPTAACMQEGTGRVLTEYVKDGGVVIADFETSVFDEEFRRRPDFLLADVFGVTLKGYRRYSPHDYFCFRREADPFITEGVSRLPAPLIVTDVETHPGVEVLADLCPPLTSRYAGRPGEPTYPFIIRNRVGNGFSYYMAGTFFELYNRYGIVHYARLVKDILARHGRPVIELLDAPPCVELTVRRSEGTGHLVVHLVNYSGGMTRPIASVTPVHGMRLRPAHKVNSARSLVHEQDLQIDSEGIVHLLPVNEFEVVLLEPAPDEESPGETS